MEYLFVYGTLLRNINNEMSHYLNANAEFVGKGYFNGEMYDIDNYPGAIISDCCSDRVYGHVYKIRDTEIVFPVLDDYEEVGPEFAAPNEYVRKIIPVYLNYTEKLMCWIYLYNHPVTQFKRIPSGDYLGYCRKGF